MKPYFETEFCALYLADCLPAMREMPDRLFDLLLTPFLYCAIVTVTTANRKESI